MTNVANKAIKSSLLMLFLRLFQRSIGLISTMILARILIPEDFGIVAIVTLVGLFFEILTQTGSEQYIIQKKDVDYNDLNTAFTLDLLTKFSLWVLFIICVPFISNFYEEPLLTWPLWISSLILPIGAFTSPKLYILKKNIEFKAFAKLEAFRKLFSFSIVLFVLIFEQSFWAIVAGDIASISFAVLGSYVIAPYKPTIGKARFKEQWIFSKWMLLKGIFGFTRSQVDTLLISKLFGVVNLGRYHMSKHIAYIPANDIVIPASEPILAALAESKNNAELFRYRFSMSMLLTFLLIFPLSLFTLYFPNLIVDFLLGEKWVDTYNLMSILGPAVLLTSINHLFETALVALAKVKEIFIFDAVTMILLVVILLMFPGQSVEDFALHRTYLLLSFLIFLTLMTVYFIQYSIKNLLILLLPSIIGAYTSLLITHWLIIFAPDNALFSFFYLAISYCVIYLVFTLSIYKLSLYKHRSEIIDIFNKLSIIPFIGKYIVLVKNNEYDKK